MFLYNFFSIGGAGDGGKREELGCGVVNAMLSLAGLRWLVLCC